MAKKVAGLGAKNNIVAKDPDIFSRLSLARQSRVPATVLPRKSRLRGGLGTSRGGFGGLWAAFGWFLAPRGLLGVL